MCFGLAVHVIEHHTPRSKGGDVRIESRETCRDCVSIDIFG